MFAFIRVGFASVCALVGLWLALSGAALLQQCGAALSRALAL
jgi:hypothetical protein